MASSVIVDHLEQMDDLIEQADGPSSQGSLLAFCDACFSDRVSKLIQSSEPSKSGLTPPVVKTEPEDGKLVVEVDVWPRKLPNAADEKERIFLEAVSVVREALSFASSPASWPDLDKWTRIEFFDLDAAMKSRAAKPVIAIYENGKLMLL